MPTLTSYPLVSIERFCCPECGGGVMWFVVRDHTSIVSQVGGISCAPGYCGWSMALDESTQLA